MLQHGTRSKVAEKAAPHLPFEEFKVESLEALLKLLERYKVSGSKIQFAESESGHTFCQKQLIHVLVPFDHYPVNKHMYREVELLYQYCPTCRLAVRIL
jgi:hypothetical protein